MIILMSLVMQCIASIISAYDLVCPNNAQRTLRSKVYCRDSYKYYCLKDANNQVYNESCRRRDDFLPKGSQFVLRGNVDSETCSVDRFQPFVFCSNRSSECELLKSRCNDIGQVLYSNGSNLHDRSCRCNYKENFAFVTTPRARCFCNPSEEDCSCFIKSCSYNRILSPDYECETQLNEKENFNCPQIQTKSQQQQKVILHYANEDEQTLFYRWIVTIIVPFVLVLGACVTFLIHKEQPQLFYKGQLLNTVSYPYRSVPTNTDFVIPKTEEGQLRNTVSYPYCSVPTNTDSVMPKTEEGQLRNTVSYPYGSVQTNTDSVMPKTEGGKLRNTVSYPYLNLPTNTDSVMRKTEEDHSIAALSAQVVLEGPANIKKKAREYIDEELRVVMVGKTGTGKSSTANTILGHMCFEACDDPLPVTAQCMQEHGYVFGKPISLIDTPGIFAITKNENEIEREIKRCIYLAAPGPHAVLFVIKYTRMSSDDLESIKKFLSYFGEELKQFVIIVFTHSGNLKNDQTLEEKLGKIPEFKNFFNECGNRYCSIDNNGPAKQKEGQVRCIISLIESVKAKNGLLYYTDYAISRAEQWIQQREVKIEERLIEEFEQAFKKTQQLDLRSNGEPRNIQTLTTPSETDNNSIKQLIMSYEKKFRDVRPETRLQFLKNAPAKFFEEFCLEKKSRIEIT